MELDRVGQVLAGLTPQGPFLIVSEVGLREHSAYLTHARQCSTRALGCCAFLRRHLVVGRGGPIDSRCFGQILARLLPTRTHPTSRSRRRSRTTSTLPSPIEADPGRCADRLAWAFRDWWWNSLMALVSSGGPRLPTIRGLSRAETVAEPAQLGASARAMAGLTARQAAKGRGHRAVGSGAPIASGLSGQSQQVSDLHGRGITHHVGGHPETQHIIAPGRSGSCV